MALDRQAFKKKFVQQDGARSHICEDDNKFNDALTEQGINAELYTQAANSSYVNLLDLGFFGPFKSFNNATPKDEGELIQAVSMAYDNYP